MALMWAGPMDLYPGLQACVAKIFYLPSDTFLLLLLLLLCRWFVVHIAELAMKRSWIGGPAGKSTLALAENSGSLNPHGDFQPPVTPVLVT